MNFSTLCTILVTFGQETPEFTTLTIAPFATIRKNRRIMPNISEYPRHTLTYFTGLLGVLVGMIFQVFVWRSSDGCCYSNQLNMGDVGKRRVVHLYSLLWHSTTDCLIVNLLSKYSMAVIRLHRIQNLVNFCPVISEFTPLRPNSTLLAGPRTSCPTRVGQLVRA